MEAVSYIENALHTASLPVSGVSGPRAQQGVSESTQTWHQNASLWFRVDWPSPPTQQQTDAATALIGPLDLSGAGLATAENLSQRAAAVSLLNAPDASPKVLRAAVLLLIDEINLLRQRDVDRAADVAAATNLADLKTRWAARSALAARTLAQAKTAITNHINAGDAD